MTQAKSALGSAIKIGDGTPGTQVNVSNATNATPIVITTATAHGMSTSDVVTIASVGGNTAANGTFLITRNSDTEFVLRASAGNGAYTPATGTATPTETFTAIAELTGITASWLLDTVDVSALDGTGWREMVPTLLSLNNVQATLNWDPDNATHDETTGFVADLLGKAARNFLLVAADTALTAMHLPAKVVGFEPTAPVDGALGGTLTLQVTGQPIISELVT